jgi:hypothetical protein
VGQERLGPSYFFISLVLGPLKSILWCVRTFLKVYIWKKLTNNWLKTHTAAPLALGGRRLRLGVSGLSGVAAAACSLRGVTCARLRRDSYLKYCESQC